MNQPMSLLGGDSRHTTSFEGEFRRWYLLSGLPGCLLCEHWLFLHPNFASWMGDWNLYGNSGARLHVLWRSVQWFAFGMNVSAKFNLLASVMNSGLTNSRVFCFWIACQLACQSKIPSPLDLAQGRCGGLAFIKFWRSMPPSPLCFWFDMSGRLQCGYVVNLSACDGRFIAWCTIRWMLYSAKTNFNAWCGSLAHSATLDMVWSLLRYLWFIHLVTVQLPHQKEKCE